MKIFTKKLNAQQFLHFTGVAICPKIWDATQTRFTLFRGSKLSKNMARYTDPIYVEKIILVNKKTTDSICYSDFYVEKEN